MMPSSQQTKPRIFADGPRHAQRFAAREAYSIAAFLAAHVPLALLMRRSVALATLHAVITALAGMWWAAPGRRVDRVRVACVGAYICGCEVLWRMCGVRVFYEFGKYATAAVFLIAVLRMGSAKVPKLAFLYFIFLLPSLPMAMATLDVRSRNQISFSMSGPMALTICVWFFSNLELSAADLRRVFLAMIGPLFGMAAVTAFNTATAVNLTFETSSNKITSGGFGPNQVSAVLGLGALLAYWITVDNQAAKGVRRFMFPVLIALGIESAMTFSRGGIYMCAGSAAVGSIYLMRQRGSRAKVVVAVVAVVLFVDLIVLPRLNEFTNGALTARFEDTRSTGRDTLAESDIELWKENPAMGVGPGVAAFTEGRLLQAASHTEFSRLLAEHGAFGLISLLALLSMALQSLIRARDARGKAIVASMIAWSFFFMMINAMRVVAPAFLFGLTFVTLDRPIRKPRPRLIRRQPARRDPVTFSELSA
jgi:O-Antigen ligase